MHQNGKISMLEPSVFLWCKFVISLGDHNHLKKWNFLVACLFICTIWTWKKSGFGGRAHDFGRVFIYAFRPLSISNPELVVT